MSKTVLDAMGGDRAPAETVAGAVEASRLGHEVLLVGDELQIKPILVQLGADLPVVHADHVIGMGDDPVRAIREKPDASISVCARMVAEGEVDGMVSAGSTGASLAAAAVLIRRVEGVLRPAVATVLPIPGRPAVLLDSGANPDCRAEHLVQFGIMGSILAEIYLGLTRPRVGLMNIGEEPGKGRNIEREAFRMMEEAPLNFVGNLEGRDVVTGKADVIVTDGFTGNVLLKASESTARFVAAAVLEALSVVAPEDLARVIPLLERLKVQIDYETFGGANLVGVRGVVVIAHGSSSRVAVANAIAMADQEADRDLVARITQRFAFE